jgi:hypothetical protein
MERANHPLTRPSLQARVHAAGRPARAARCDCARSNPRVFAGTPASSRGVVRPTILAPSTGYLCIRGRFAAARTASAAFVPAGTQVTSSSTAQGFVGGDGMSRHSQRIVCSSRTGLIGGNHPSSVSHLDAEDKSAAATTNAVAAELRLLLGQFCEQGAGQF